MIILSTVIKYDTFIIYWITMYFTTKKDLLVYLGKDPKDVRLVERMIKRWEVSKEANGYELLEKVKKSDLESYHNQSDLETIWQLQEELSKIRSKVMDENFEATITDNASAKELEEARIQWKYYERELSKMILLCKHIMMATYEKHKAYYEKCNIDKFEYKDQLVSYAKEKAKIDSIEWFC